MAEGKILYVDDGSKDTTWKLIEQLSESHRCVAGLKLAHNVGHQQALWAGLDFVAAGDYDAAVSIDADLQDDVNAIVEMVDYYNQGPMWCSVYGGNVKRTRSSRNIPRRCSTN